MTERIDARIKLFTTGDGGPEHAPSVDGRYQAILKAPNGHLIVSRLLSGENVELGAEVATTWELVAPLYLVDPAAFGGDPPRGLPSTVVPEVHFKELVEGAKITVMEGPTAIGTGRITRRYSATGVANAV